MKKLLFITTRLFWPTDSGRKVSLYYYCKGLHDVYGYEIYLYSFLEPGQNAELVDSKPYFIKQVKIATPIGKFKKLLNLGTKSLFGGWPFQNSLFYSNKNVKRIKNYCAEIDPDVIMVDMIRLAPYYKSFEECSCKKILDLDDMLSKRYMRQYLSKNSKSSVLGNYSAAVDGAGKSVLEKGCIKRFVLKSESKRTKKAEIKYGKIYDNVVFVSQKETDEYNKVLNGKAVTVRLGVDYKLYSEEIAVEQEPNSLVFMGNMKVAANIDSLHMIVSEILPRLNFDYKFYVVGAIDSYLKEKYQSDKIIFLGRVDDVRPEVERCSIFLAPIAYGTGIKTKILEAMAMGMPVATNSVGAEGIDGIPGEHFIVCDDVEKLSNLVDELIQDSERCKKLSENAVNLIKSEYDWTEVYGSFKDLGL